MPNASDEAKKVSEAIEVARVAREEGLPQEQVEQLARATDDDAGDLSDAAGAAARWS